MIELPEMGVAGRNRGSAPVRKYIGTATGAGGEMPLPAFGPNVAMP